MMTEQRSINLRAVSCHSYLLTEGEQRLFSAHFLLHGGITMLYTIAVVLIILWLLGLVSSYTIGGFIHILLVVAVIMVLVKLISGRGI
jgi:hypothetical protein